jgi:hypothetical protein
MLAGQGQRLPRQVGQLCLGTVGPIGGTGVGVGIRIRLGYFDPQA